MLAGCKILEITSSRDGWARGEWEGYGGPRDVTSLSLTPYKTAAVTTTTPTAAYAEKGRAVAASVPLPPAGPAQSGSVFDPGPRPNAEQNLSGFAALTSCTCVLNGSQTSSGPSLQRRMRTNACSFSRDDLCRAHKVRPAAAISAAPGPSRC